METKRTDKSPLVSMYLLSVGASDCGLLLFSHAITTMVASTPVYETKSCTRFTASVSKDYQLTFAKVTLSANNNYETITVDSAD